MTFPILGGNGAVAGYSIDNSLRFNDDDSPRLTRTPSSAGNRRIYTISTWVKRSNLGGEKSIFGAAPTTAVYSWLAFDQDKIKWDDYSGGTQGSLRTSRLFRDTSAWYHIVFAVDTTQATESNRLKLYVNGVEETNLDYKTATQNHESQINNTTAQCVGDLATGYAGTYPFDGYFAETYFIDGTQLQASDFGEFDEDSGVWKPKNSADVISAVTFGTNGFYLDFENSGSLGADQSGNGNNFTPTNLASTDQTTDTPTNNFATMNPLYRSRQANNGVFSEGNTKLTYTASNDNKGTVLSTMGASSGKWYWEVKVLSASREMIGVGYNNVGDTTGAFHDSSPSNGFSIFAGNGNLYYDATNTSYGSSFSVNDIIMVALDMDNHLCWFGKNGTWFDSATQSEIENSTATNDATTQMGTQQNLNSGEPVFPLLADTSATGQASFEANFGNPSFSISSGNSDGNGYGNFEYAPPSGYLALCTQNLATELSPTIDDGSQYFNTVLYSGNGGTNAVTGVGFKPDWIWVKERSSTSGHRLADTTRGATKSLTSNDTGLETTNANIFSSLDSDGFTHGADNGVNESGQTYASWNWKANGGTTSSNTDGSITSTVQANTTAGFSVVTFTGTGANGTFGHGLGAVPKFIIFKNRTDASNWICYHEALGNTTGVYLNLTNANSGTSSAFFNNTTPTSSVVSVGVMNEGNGSGDNIVAYCFAEIEGYSKFGSYTGNGSTDGTFVYTGFRPAWLLIKKTDVSGSSWFMWDNKRSTYNQMVNALLASGSDAELTDREMDFTSNGFKTRATDGNYNGSGNSYIYMAFAENPFVSSSGVPVVAR